MKAVLYGLPCAGKTTLMSGLKGIKAISGSKALEKLSGGFTGLSEREKHDVRIKYTEYIASLEGDIISDGHFAFPGNRVFTEHDGSVYDVFLYLYCEPSVIKSRIDLSDKNKKFGTLSEEIIKKWQDQEIAALREECHIRGKEFCVIPADRVTPEGLGSFFSFLKSEGGAFKNAELIFSQIKELYQKPCELYLSDGDGTVIDRDSLRHCVSGYSTNIFDGDFYTQYQSWEFGEDTKRIDFSSCSVEGIELNTKVYDHIKDKSCIVLSSGITALWNKIGDRLGLKNIIAGTYICADTKYYVTKFLRKAGYTITAFGNSQNDIYMLREADTGYLITGKRMSRSLRNTDLSGIRLILDTAPVIIEELYHEETAEDISVCRSCSGINGGRLAAAHTRLGELTGRVISDFLPSENTAVIAPERGGRFFGGGLYSAFGQYFCPLYRNQALPDIHPASVVIADSVINSGKTVLDIIQQLKKNDSSINIVIAANVINKKALDLLKSYKIFAVRVSENSFIGKNQSQQKDGFGPDTADRLFGLINNSIF